MKCINCYREIDDGLKFCPKCGFMQPDDRESYEREHPELAKGSSHNYSELDESYEYSSPIAASSEDNDTSYIETIPVQEEPYTDESYEDDSEMQLSVFVVSSVRGTGACLRESPTTSSKALSVYSDGTYFDGYYSDVYPWIAVVENGSIIGYIHDENVTSY